jgi:OOP family OmpA-OmpF porin
MYWWISTHTNLEGDKMIRKIISVAVCFTVIIIQAGAQELGIELNGGLQGMKYQLQNGQNKQLPGGSLGLNYTFRLSSRLGMLTGITGGVYRSEATMQDGVVFTSGQVDDAGSAFQYSAKATGYKETQQFFAASIPLLLQYRTAGTGTQWYFDGGVKVLIPFSTSIQISAHQMSVSGYYPDFNLDVSNLPQHGFGTIDGWKVSTTTKLKPAAALSAATGLSFSLSTGTRLYTGLYFDYGLTDLKDKNGTMPLITYSSTSLNGVQANSVLNTQNVGKVILFSFGLQVRLSFGSTRAKPTAQPKTKIDSQQTANPTNSNYDSEAIQRPVVFGIVGETSIPEIQKLQLDEVAHIMKQHPDIRISIVGHTCNSETEMEKIKVGEVRAKAVARYLRGKGIDGQRMDINFAKERDTFLLYDPPANYRNRRVVIKME